VAYPVVPLATPITRPGLIESGPKALLYCCQPLIALLLSVMMKIRSLSHVTGHF